jgi:hypothetical protein
MQRLSVAAVKISEGENQLATSAAKIPAAAKE